METSKIEESENDVVNEVPESFIPSTIINHLGLGMFQFFIVLYAGTIFCAEACELTMLSLLLPEIKEYWNLSNHEESLAGSIVFLGMFCGNFAFGIIADLFGRKFGLGLCNAILAIAGSCRAISPTFWFFNICGFISGFAIGGNVTAFTLYIECLPKKIRGVTLLNIELFWVFGAVLEAGLGWLILSRTLFQTYVWNWFVLISIFPTVFSILLLPFTPESLRYMYLKKDEAGMRSLVRRIEWMNCRKLPENYTIDFSVLDSKKKKKNNKGGSKKKSFFSRSIFTKYKDLLRWDTIMIILSLCLFYVCSSFCYYGVVLAAPGFFSGQGESYRFLGSFLSSVAELPGVLFATVLLFFFSRKCTQVTTFFACGFALLAMSFPDMPKWWYLGWGIISRGSVMASSSVVWILAQESLPTSIRSVGCGIASGSGKIATVFAPLVAEEFPDNQELIPKIVFALASVIAGICCIFYPIETKGRVLDEQAGGEGLEVEMKDVELEKGMKEESTEEIVKEEEELKNDGEIELQEIDVKSEEKREEDGEGGGEIMMIEGEGEDVITIEVRGDGEGRDT